MYAFHEIISPEDDGFQSYLCAIVVIDSTNLTFGEGMDGGGSD